MPPALQAKLLRVLQEQAFERVGGNETVRTDVRLIATTHRDLKACSEEGRFRPDLYYRLGVFTVHLPPLRERDDDLPILVRHYLRRFSRELGRHVREAAPGTLERLGDYPWPGNVRELQSVLKQALLRASGPSCCQPSCPNPPVGPASPTRRRHRGKGSAWRSRCGEGRAPTPVSCTRRRTASWTGSCCPSSWNTPGTINTRRPDCWGSPGRPCARNSATWGCLSRAPPKRTKTIRVRTARLTRGAARPPTG
jgi:Sigma-54 interaction domain